MAKILFTWELGGGMGHVAPYLPLARGLREKGHEVAFVLRDLSQAETSLGQAGFPYFQAPIVLKGVGNQIHNPSTFAQILNNVGYSNVQLLTGLAKAWQQIFQSYQPDLIIHDHSPTALIASRNLDCRKIVIGSGFFIPPNVPTPPLLRTRPAPDMDVVAADEARILANINHVLVQLGSDPLDRIAQLYDVDSRIMTSYSEFDHYPGRPQGDVTYWGTLLSGLGSKPVWPAVQGKRIYAYLKPFQKMPALFQYLNKIQASVIVYAPELIKKDRLRLASESIHFSETPLDLIQAAAGCDIAITNSTHGTVATFLLAGKPVLLLPIYFEQAKLARNIERMGAGLWSGLGNPQDMNNKLQMLLDDSRYRHAAEEFAKKYAGVADDVEQKLIQHIDQLL